MTLFKNAYTYEDQEDGSTTERVRFYNVHHADNTLISGNQYIYDELGNITQITHSEGSRFPLATYDYDDQGQLVTETIYDGNGTGSSHITATYTYTYDTAGNILS